MLSQENCVDTLTIALGNPIRAPVLQKQKESQGDLIMSSFSITGSWEEHGEDELEENTEDDMPTEASASFLYKANPKRYDTGYYISVAFSWNDGEHYCVENKALYNRYLQTKTFRKKILPKIPHLSPVTWVEIKTKGGKIKVTDVSKEISKEKAYLPCPKSLAPTIPRVSISSLRICHTITTLSDFIDIVTLYEDLGPTRPWYAFKRYQIPVEEECDSMDDLLSECEILSRFEGFPYIIKPAFIVTNNRGDNDDDEPLFRGFLMPFMPAGSLLHVFAELRVRDADWREPMFLHPAHLKEFTQTEETLRLLKVKPPVPQLPWELKFTWAIEATSALVSLHEHAIYSGDLKLPNILLDREGHLQLIDVAPQMGFTTQYAAPELDLKHPDVLPLTEARDVFAFGIILWQIAEEEWNVARDDNSKIPDLDWRSGRVQGPTPTWYRGLVRRCIDVNPAKRPSAKEILDVLESKK